MTDQIYWYSDAAGMELFATTEANEVESHVAWHLWGYGKWWFRIGASGELHDPAGWAGRAAMESLFGERFDRKKWNAEHEGW
jgi:hypothetical protein